MLKKISLLTLLLSSQLLIAQKHITREAYIRFFGTTPMENIDAASKQASSVIDAENGNIVFQVLVNGFVFEKALMQEHFNENYAESETYPKAIFKGNIGDVSLLDLSKDATFETMVGGTMSFHGVDKEIAVPTTIIIKKGKVSMQANFKMIPEDYNIKIPSAVRDKIAKEFDVEVKANYQLK